MLGLIGLVFMLVLSLMYFNEIGWKILLGAWIIILLVPFLQLVGVGGGIVVLVQGVVTAGVYLTAKSE